MDLEDFTPRKMTKKVVKTYVGMKAKELATDIITDYTNFEEDDKIVGISTMMIGGYVAARFEPLTDKLVDKAADFINEKRGIKNDPEPKKPEEQ